MTAIVCISHTKMYSEAMHEVVRKINDVRSIEKHIYTNVLALMAVFVAVFSIINVNVSLVSKEKLDLTMLLVFNLCTIGAIGFLVSITKSWLSPKCTMIISGFSLLVAPVLSATERPTSYRAALNAPHGTSEACAASGQK